VVRIDIDLDSISVISGGNFPIGKHRARLTSCQEEESSTGNPMLVWDWEGADDESQGETIRSWTSLLDHALGAFKTHAEAFGFHGDTTVDTDACVDQYATLVVGMRKRRGGDGDEEARPSVITVLPDETPSKAARPAVNGPVPRRIGGGGGNARPSPSARLGARRPSPKVDDELPF
jgi:hypothetical protein